MTNTNLWIGESVFIDLQELAERFYPYETGGMLMGYQTDEADIVVRKIIGPGPNAKHHRLGYIPDSEYQQSELESYFYSTGGKETYLGDWHTHPNGTSKMSIIDKRTLARIANMPSSRIKRPVMAILSRKESHWIMGITQFVGLEKRFLFTRYNLTYPNLIKYSDQQ